MVDDVGSVTASGVGELVASVYDSGTMGEFTDYFNKNCGVTVTLQDPTTNSVYHGSEISAFVTGTASALKSCLGDSDGDPSTNVEVEQWDYGNFASVDPTLPGEFPHLVKLVKTDGTIDPVNAIVWFDSTNSNFIFQTKVPAGSYAIYSTDGTLARVAKDDGSASGDMDSLAEMGSVATGFKKYSTVIHTTAEIGCSEADGSILHCIEKGDLIVLGMTTLVGLPDDGFTIDGGLGEDAAFAYVPDNSANFYKVSVHKVNVIISLASRHTINGRNHISPNPKVHSIRTKDSETVSTITVGRSMFYGNDDENFDQVDTVTRTPDSVTYYMVSEMRNRQCLSLVWCSGDSNSN